VIGRRFQGAGDAVVLFGEGRGELGGSEYLKLAYDLVRGAAPALDLDAERALQALLVSLADERLLRSAHDCSDGGLAVTVAECCFDAGGIGVEVSIPGVQVASAAATNVAAALFGESASRIVVSVVPDNLTMVLERAAAAKVPAHVVGRTGGNRIRMAVAGRLVIDQAVDEAERAWAAALERYFVKKVA
jgi:phosphoribosylformylglycinamidine synthase